MIQIILYVCTRVCVCVLEFLLNTKYYVFDYKNKTTNASNFMVFLLHVLFTISYLKDSWR